jgi:pimeloyl-ACP methyl ester carboxylesterase
MAKVISKDGTTIAYEKKGTGQPVILVDGALGYRALGFGTQLVDLLAPHFTVYAYDRRGRGESGNSKPFAVEREVEDIEALINSAGGKAFVYGISSGACLALEAAMKLGHKIKKLALYEPPYNSAKEALQPWKEYRRQVAELVSANRRDDAVALFMRFVGAPDAMIEGMRQAPLWPLFEASAPTLPYDAAAMGEDRSVPVGRAAKVTAETLVMDGGASLQMIPFMHETATALANAIPRAHERLLEGQRHDVDAKVLAPALIDFFGKGDGAG